MTRTPVGLFVVAIAAIGLITAVVAKVPAPITPELQVAPAFPPSWRCTERPLQQGSGTVRVCEPPKEKAK